jgi:hypothetical protein
MRKQFFLVSFYIFFVVSAFTAKELKVLVLISPSDNHLIWVAHQATGYFLGRETPTLESNDTYREGS